MTQVTLIQRWCGTKMISQSKKQGIFKLTTMKMETAVWSFQRWLEHTWHVTTTSATERCSFDDVMSVNVSLQVSGDDDAKYTVKAVNSLGEATCTAELLVEVMAGEEEEEEEE